MRPILAALGLAAMAVGLSGCESPRPDPSPRPPERPDRPAPPPSPEETKPPRAGPESETLRRYYAGVEDHLRGQGLLRRDGGGLDTPYDADRLAQTFLQIALYEEYDLSGDRVVAAATESRLHRWETPVRIELRFGDSVPARTIRKDRADVAALAARLGRATDHPVSVVESDANFVVFVVSEDERRALGPELRRLMPGLSDGVLGSVLDLPQPSYCVVFAADEQENDRYTRAFAVIRAEHPDLLRLSCYHEEIAQGLGLANDSPRARPSIFNDDEEFALLTPHDANLLSILYDPRLRAGMTQDEARPIVRALAREVTGEGPEGSGI